MQFNENLDLWDYSLHSIKQSSSEAFRICGQQPSTAQGSLGGRDRSKSMKTW